jgi:hypothetical protein
VQWTGEAVHLYVEACRLQAAAGNIHALALPQPGVDDFTLSRGSYKASRGAMTSGEHDVMGMAFLGRSHSNADMGRGQRVESARECALVVQHREEVAISNLVMRRQVDAGGLPRSARDMSQATLGNG